MALLPARHHAGKSVLLISLLAMCKTVGAASECGSQTLSSSNITAVQECTIIDGDLTVRRTLSGHPNIP